MRPGWIPIRFFWRHGQPMVDWCLLGEQRLTDPFFETTIQTLLMHPFHQAFRRETPVATLGEWYNSSPGILPAGFIFHSSRCGSTLVCRMLGALERNVVLSEPPPADSILRSYFHHPDVSLDQRVQWFRWMVSALGQRRGGQEDRLFIKFDAWNIAELPVIRHAFPETPWIFLYREPVEVLVSQLREPSPWTFPGVLHPEVVGMHWNEIAQLSHQEYCARLLARIFRLGLELHLQCSGHLVNYRELPEFACSPMLDHFGIVYTRSEIDRMRSMGVENAKYPGSPFVDDSRSKQDSAGESIRELSRRWVEPVYQELEAARLTAEPAKPAMPSPAPAPSVR